MGSNQPCIVHNHLSQKSCPCCSACNRCSSSCSSTVRTLSQEGICCLRFQGRFRFETTRRLHLRARSARLAWFSPSTLMRGGPMASCEMGLPQASESSGESSISTSRVPRLSCPGADAAAPRPSTAGAGPLELAAAAEPAEPSGQCRSSSGDSRGCQPTLESRNRTSARMPPRGAPRRGAAPQAPSQPALNPTPAAPGPSPKRAECTRARGRQQRGP
mmetsp:Transcript_81631/g.234570  ORF Transcript_81631/g.234570 Transcript_81631/m.234570 type:complete len:217 (+) Transcript_81631:508-1158(+)